ncbi:zinc ribbon domain-containing protein [Paenibacillus sp. J2TS4]|uniref:zinc ribbon domain-containing protein n=1 Tax=Paenibacillus sp. J2TS4 TaxID=2807194 RepID=UPI001B00D52D|nr:zinc ribbon domain-containing protein [Paenibacillus sp. J2TS4]GIP32585.1 metal-binding protein [Paenibacillus sp. J2TS4]
MNHFKGLIKCLNCGKNYKFKQERKKPTYLCSGFANYGKEFCARFSIAEEELFHTIENHWARYGRAIETKEEAVSTVKLIEVKNRGYVITYQDGTESIINSSDSEYGIKVKY